MILPGLVRKAECGWRNSEDGAEGNGKVIFSMHMDSFVAQLLQASAGAADV